LAPKGKKQHKSTYLGPVGTGVVVQVTDHALGRLIERLTPGGEIAVDEFEQLDTAAQEVVFQRALAAGLPYQEFLSAVKTPNAGRPDELSLAHGGWNSRYCRWVRVPAGHRRATCPIVFEILDDSSQTHPGRILLVTVLPIHR